MREGAVRMYTLKYHRHRTRPNLIRLLEYVNVPEAEAALQRLRACARYSPCRMYTCPNCGPKHKGRAKDEALSRIAFRLGRFPEREEVSFVTIRGPVVELDPELAEAGLGRLKRKIVKFIQRKAPSSSWIGFWDTSLNGVIHLHAVVLHPELRRSALEGLLKGSFGEKDQVRISRWKRSQSLAESLQGVLNYALIADRHGKVYRFVDGPEREEKLVHGPDAGVRIAKRIAVVQHLAGRGVQGIRFTANLKPVTSNIVIQQLVNLHRTTRRVNRKTMPNQSWAPRGVLGTHLGKNPVRG